MSTSPLDPSAIVLVGIGCRFPGAPDADAMGRLLLDPRDAIRPIGDRWDVAAWTKRVPSFVEHGGWLDDIEHFDPAPFATSAREAAAMDPQHRLLLEVAREAMADACLADDALKDRAIGVYVGIGASEYDTRFESPEGVMVDGSLHSGIGNDASFAPNRISMLYGFRGPSLAINTACSSALVCLHAAVQDVRDGRIDGALVASVNLAVIPESTARLARMGVLAPDGRCKSFDAGADGYGRGEGAAAVLILRAGEAEAFGLRPLAVVKGTAVNHTAGTSGLVAPTSDSQVELLQAALDDAGLTADDIDAVEAHGTGTSVGDPVELEALRRVFGTERSRPLVVTASKAHVGHLEVAAGMASLVSAVLSLRSGQLAPFPHLHEPIAAADGFVLPRRALAWPSHEGVRRVGVSAFGMGGTNAHVVLEQPPAPVVEEDDGIGLPYVLPLSAHHASALPDLAAEAADVLVDPAHVVARIRTACRGRSAHPWRLAAVGGSPAELSKVLRKAHGDGVDGLFHGDTAPTPRVALLFSGQGSLTARPGEELRRIPVFEAALQECEALAAPLLGHSLLASMYEGEEPLRQTSLQQPAVLALGYAQWRLWTWLGLQARVVLGHSVGELPALVAAGRLPLSEAMAFAVERGRRMQELPEGGSMAAVFASVDDVRPHLPDGVDVAAINHPTLTTLSGDAEGIARVLEALSEKGIDGRSLHVSHAFHSHRMDPCLDALAEVGPVADAVSQPAVTFVSTVRGARHDGVVDGAYWREHARQAVRFHDAVDAALAEGITTFVEVGAGATLADMARRGRRQLATFLATLDEDGPALAAFARALARTWVAGPELDLGAWLDLAHPGVQRARFPVAPYQRRRTWIDVERGPAMPAMPDAPAMPAPPMPAPPPPSAGLAHGASEAPADWFWRLQAIPTGPVGEAPTRPWLVLCDGSGRGDALLAAFPGSRAVRVGEATGASDDGSFHIDPTDDRAFDALLEHAAPFLEDAAGVVDLWSLDERNDAASVTGRAVLALRLAKALALRRVLPVHARVWFVTEGTQGTHGSGHGGVWGLVRTLAFEHPELRAGAVDLDPGARDLGALVALLRHEVEENQVLLHGGDVKALRLAPAPPPSDAQLPDLSAGHVLITGGLGALGLSFAEGLVSSGATKLVLFGRSEPRPRAREVIDTLRQQGVEVRVEALDVTDGAALATLVQELGTVSGVVHAAGVLDDGVLVHQTAQRFRDVLHAKVAGTLALRDAVSGQPVRIFALCSSVSSMLGAPGQANYAVANAFMDRLAVKLRGEGLPAVSIQWGPWREGGMAQEHLARIASRGMRPLDPHLARAALGPALASGGTVGVFDLDRETVRGLGPRLTGQPVLRGLFGDAVTEVDRDPLSGPEALTEWVARHVATALGVEPAELSTDRPLTWAGFDSLMAQELRRSIEDELGVVLENGALNGGPSVAQIVAKVQGAAPDGVERPVAAVVAEPKRLGFDDVPAVPVTGALGAGAGMERALAGTAMPGRRTVVHSELPPAPEPPVSKGPGDWPEPHAPLPSKEDIERADGPHMPPEATAETTPVGLQQVALVVLLLAATGLGVWLSM